MFWIGTLPSLSTHVYHKPSFIQNVQRSNLSQKTNYSDVFIIVLHIPPRKKWKSTPNILQSLPNLFQFNTHIDHPTIKLHSVPYWQHHKKNTKKMLSVLLCCLVFIMAIAWHLILNLLYHLYCHTLCHQAIILPPFCVLRFLLIHEILAAISSLKSMTHVTHYTSQYFPTKTGCQISA